MLRRLAIKLRAQEGFTLVEIATVLVIIAILIVVAAASFFGQQKKANAVVVKQQVAGVAKAAHNAYLDNNDDFPIIATLINQIEAAEPQFTTVAGVGCAKDEIRVERIDTELIKICMQSSDGQNIGYTLNNRGQRANSRETAIAQPGAAFTNLIRNPSFEAPALGPNWLLWPGTPAGSVTLESRHATSGEKSVHVNNTNPLRGFYAPVTLTAGARYYAKANVFLEDGEALLYVSTGGLSPVVLDSTTDPGENTLEVEFQQSGGDLTYNIYLFTWDNNDGGDFYVDDVILSRITAPGQKVNYFDGDFPNGSWSGVPHASTSGSTWPGEDW